MVVGSIDGVRVEGVSSGGGELVVVAASVMKLAVAVPSLAVVVRCSIRPPCPNQQSHCPS